MFLQLQLLPQAALVHTTEVLHEDCREGLADVVLRPSSGDLLYFLRHGITGEEKLLEGGPWTLAALPDGGGEYIFNASAEEPELLDDIFQAKLYTVPSTQKVLLCERDDAGKALAVDLDVYRTCSSRVLLSCTVPSRHSEVQLPGISFCVPRAPGRLYISFYAVLLKLLAFSVVKVSEPSLFVHKHLPKLKTWTAGLGFEEPWAATKATLTPKYQHSNAT
jgi:hypothetical protein